MLLLLGVVVVDVFCCCCWGFVVVVGCACATNCKTALSAEMQCNLSDYWGAAAGMGGWRGWREGA